MKRRPYSDPAFVAEMDELRRQRHAAFVARTGSGLPIDEAGRPVPVDPDGPLAVNLRFPIGTPRSTFRRGAVMPAD